ncbi:MAG: GIY-YIG nuclease family protein [Patescibacteria group bacterium]
MSALACHSERPLPSSPRRRGSRKEKKKMSACVYILASSKNGTLYTGVTAALIKRVYEHKNKFVTGFAEHYGTTNLVYYEMFDDIENAIAREKHIKKWNRAWKIKLIEKTNPQWKDLYQEILV